MLSGGVSEFRRGRFSRRDRGTELVGSLGSVGFFVGWAGVADRRLRFG